jgi:two-component system response regulator GlrR
MLHDWPGNVRELENSIEFAVAMATGHIITDELILPDEGANVTLPTFSAAKDGFEKNYLTNLLKITGGNVSKASELAGKYRADFYNLLKKHGLSPDDFKP